MSDSANVRSLEALERLRSALIQVQHALAATLEEIGAKCQHFLHWLESDAPEHWRAEIRKAFDAVAEARVALERCRMNRVAGHQPSCVEERKALERARRRLEFCQQQLERTRRWHIAARHETDEFHGRLGSLRQAVENGIPKAVTVLERMIAALEEYLAVQSDGEAIPRTTDEDPQEFGGNGPARD